MLRTRRRSAVRFALTAGLLGLAALAQAEPLVRANDMFWTQVDLEGVSSAAAGPGIAAEPAAPELAPVQLPATEKSAWTFALSAKDRTVRAGLERWMKDTAWKLSWELPESAQGGVVRFDADFGPDLEVAISKLLAAMRGDNPANAYFYQGNKVLRIADVSASSAVPMTPTVQGEIQKDPEDRGLPYVTRVPGYWLGTNEGGPTATPAAKLPAVFVASVSLVFSERATLATVIGILAKVTRIPILLPGALEYSAAQLIESRAGATPRIKAKGSEGKTTYAGTPEELLDRISVITGLLWEFQDGTIVFMD